MALIAMDGKYLIHDASYLAFKTPTEKSIPGIIAFYDVEAYSRSLEPTSNLCKNRQYYLKVFVPGEEGVMYLSGNYNRYTRSEEISKAVIFKPETEVIHTGQSFYGRLLSTNNNQGDHRMDHQFAIIPITHPEVVGYKTPLPSLLSDCNICGCLQPIDHRFLNVCSSIGICNTTIKTVCDNNMLCGELYGKCKGQCKLPNTVCAKFNGSYQCVTRSATPAFIGTVVVILLLVLIAVIMYYSFTLLPKTNPRANPVITEYP
jgi:hypothetical protein